MDCECCSYELATKSANSFVSEVNNSIFVDCLLRLGLDFVRKILSCFPDFKFGAYNSLDFLLSSSTLLYLFLGFSRPQVLCLKCPEFNQFLRLSLFRFVLTE